MQIDLSKIDQSKFAMREETVAGEKCHFVFPLSPDLKWTKDELIFRSSVWTAEGKLCSAGFPKFFNHQEKPHLYPDPSDHKDWNILSKEDGSLLIVSRYNSELIVRTRRCLDATTHENGPEIAILKQKYPKVFTGYYLAGLSFLYEWVSGFKPFQIVNYNDVPDIYLVGIIDHEDYSLATQEELDKWGEFLGVKRPKRYAFNNISDCIGTVKELKGVEGVCLYYNGDQNIVKLKSDWYLHLFRLKSQFSSTEAIVDLFILLKYPNFNDFYNHMLSIDFEIANCVRGEMSRVCDAYKESQKIINHMLTFVEKWRILPRKDIAEKILSAYGNTGRSDICFCLLDGKLQDKQIKRLIMQNLKR